MKTYEIKRNSGTRYVTASSRQRAVMKLTGMTESAAIAAAQIISVRVCK